jgi:hypothetical protein
MIPKILKITDDPLDKAVKFRMGYTSESGDINFVIDKIFEQIRGVIIQSKKPFSISDIKVSLKVVMLNLLMAVRKGGSYCVRYSRNKNKYTKSRYNQNNLKLKALVLVVHSLEVIGLICNKIGYRDENRKHSIYGRRESRIWLTDKWIETFKQCGLFDAHHLISNVSEVIIRKGKKINGNANEVDYRDVKLTREMRLSLNKYNELLLSSDISHPVNPCVDRCLYRVFNNNSWKQGGRFYGSCFQKMSVLDGERRSGDQYRNDILIHRYPVAELDYKSLHPSILYHIENQQVPNDCYDVDGLPRNVVKVALQIVINAKNGISAEQALRKEIKKRGIFLTNGFNVSGVIDAVKRKHSAIRKHFFSSQGIYLQFRDSQVTELILSYFTDKNIIVLPVHDSYIIDQKYVGHLHEVMMVEFMRQFGFGAKIDRKY